jgi:hypothetical protein
VPAADPETCILAAQRLFVGFPDLTRAHREREP